MEMRKVLIARMKGGIGDAVAMTQYILNGLSSGVLVLPDEVVSYTVDELPALGQDLATDVHVGLPPVEVVPLAKDESSESDSVDSKIVNILGSLVYPKKEETQHEDKPSEAKEEENVQEPDTEVAAGNFKPTGANTAIKRETYARLEQYKNRTGLRWAQRVSQATGGRVSPDVIRFGLIEARDIGIDRWKLIAKALDELEKGVTEE